MKKYTISDPDYFCPKCGNDKLVGKSRLCYANTYEMWVQCEECGFDPCVENGKHIKTVSQWNDELAVFALKTWMDKIKQGKAMVR